MRLRAVRGRAGAIAVATVVGALAAGPAAGASGPGTASDAPTPSTATPEALQAGIAPGAGSVLNEWTRDLLARSTDLGPSDARDATVMANLRGDAEPVALEQWAAASGVRVTWYPGDDWAVVSGPAEALGSALHVRIDEYRALSGRTFYAATASPRSPDTDVASFGSIDSYGHFAPLDVPAGGITPAGLRQAYDIAPLTARGFEGQGETIVFFEVDGFNQSDLDQFAARNGLPPMHITVVGGQAGPVTGETELDLESAHAVAPLAREVYFNFATQSAGVMADDFKEVTARFPGALWSMSIGACELEFGFDTSDFENLESALADAVDQGTTVFVSSGDAGGLECTPPADFGQPPQQSFFGVSLPADFPAVVSVGGTSLDVTTTGAYAGEEAWTEPLLSQGSGGGISVVWGPPKYQTGPGTGDFGQDHPGRQVPDVAGLADPATGFAAVINGSPTPVGGTSLAAPIWASSMALVDQFLKTQGVSPRNLLAQQAFYQLAETPRPFAAFHDITLGGNAIYSATPGYDMVTGLGTADVWNLARDLAALGRS